MTVLSITERCRTFPLDQMLEARRRGVLICLSCADDSEPIRASRETPNCVNCGELRLMEPETIIKINLGGGKLNAQSGQVFDRLARPR